MVAVDALDGRGPPGAARHVRDATMTEREQVVGRRLGPGAVRRGDGWYALAEGHAWIGDDERVAGRLERRELDARLLRKRDDRAVGGAVREVLEHRDLALVLVQRRVEDDPHVLLVRCFERAREDVGEVVASDHGHGQADVAGAAAGQGACAAVRREVVLAHMTEDDVARLGRDVGPVVDDT